MAEHRLIYAGGARDLLPNRWDLIAFPLIIGALSLAAVGARQTLVPLTSLTEPVVSLDPANLPEYALRTTLRMLAAMVLSLVFTFTYGTLAAKSRAAGRILIPVLDILQSVPVLGYIAFTVTFFMGLFPGEVAGAELAVIFAIFTAQAWNMTFSFYQSLITVPHDLEEATRSFHFTGWQRFWKLEVPFAMPGLIWNMMMSMSGSWFFIVASEAITVGDTTITLPGIGAYLARAISDKSLSAVGWVILAMTIVIVIYDQLMFRPLVAWADKFRFEQTASGLEPKSWVLALLRRTRLFNAAVTPFGWIGKGTLAVRFPRRAASPPWWRAARRAQPGELVWYLAVAAFAAYGAYSAVDVMASELGWSEVWTAVEYGFFTFVRVLLLIVVAAIIWVPIGVHIGLRPRIAEKIQPLVQFLAAFPANLFFPIFAIVITELDLNPDIWLSPLIILGTQWYILFNVIAGATAFPTDFREAAVNFRIRGWQWWRQVMLPGIFPYFVTGAITASGGAWNASIVAEVISWGDIKLQAHGLGAYIAKATADGDWPRNVLGILVMSGIVVFFNRIFWRPLYRYAASRLRLD